MASAQCCARPGRHVLRLEATVHNTKQLRCRRSLENFLEIINRLAGMAERFATILDCADTSSLPDGMLDQLPLPSRIGATPHRRHRPDKPGIRTDLAAAPALAAAPQGFTVAEFTTKGPQVNQRADYLQPGPAGPQRADHPPAARRHLRPHPPTAW